MVLAHRPGRVRFRWDDIRDAGIGHTDTDNHTHALWVVKNGHITGQNYPLTR